MLQSACQARHPSPPWSSFQRQQTLQENTDVIQFSYHSEKTRYEHGRLSHTEMRLLHLAVGLYTQHSIQYMWTALGNFGLNVVGNNSMPG